ncbi:MAG TPA: hypothetical protein VGP07_25605 [Polyangia bacterium]|jgi:hypothetical protein
MAKSGLNDEGGCAVDWSWLHGERIAAVTSGLDFLTITFDSGLVFTTRSLLWQGKPFLAFNPHAAPAAAIAGTPPPAKT